MSETLYPSLHLLEITLRNAVHEIARVHFGNPFWFEGPTTPLTADHTAQAAEARQQIVVEQMTKRRPATTRITDDQLIAKLPFGFWTLLFSSGYARTLFLPVLARVFPHAPRWARDRKRLARRLHDIRMFRNRVFHHESIWRHNSQGRHAEILATIRWINPQAAALLQLTDRFDIVFNRTEADYLRLVSGQFT